jgi:hypothetical protein
MHPEVGDLMFSSISTNIWADPGDTHSSTVVGHLGEKQPVIILRVYRRKYFEKEITEIKILGPEGVVGWVAVEKLMSSWVIL